MRRVRLFRTDFDGHLSKRLNGAGRQCFSVPQVAEPWRGQSPTKLSRCIIVPRGVSRSAQGASDLEHASKRGSDRLVGYRARLSTMSTRGSASIDRSI